MSESFSRTEQMRAVIYPGDPWTAVKQDVYRRYVQCWMPKVLNKGMFDGTIIDPFTTAGVYTEGLDASPLTIARAYLTHDSRPGFAGHLRLIWSDERSDRLEELAGQWAKVTAELGSDPNLDVYLDPTTPMTFAGGQAAFAARAHSGPTLWLLDPYGWDAIPFDAVAACLQAPRSEAIITLMTANMHRIRHEEAQAPTLTRCYGTDAWKALRDEDNAAKTSAGFAEVYAGQLRQRGLLTRSFSILVGADTAPRYELIFATHHPKGLKCWNDAGWALDRYRGGGASRDSAGALTLFDDRPDLDPLRLSLEAIADKTRVSWSELDLRASSVGYKEKHLRLVLDDMAAEGRAIRVDSMGGRTSWPEGCAVMFYNAAASSFDE